MRKYYLQKINLSEQDEINKTRQSSNNTNIFR
jgi:hypothetical protein